MKIEPFKIDVHQIEIDALRARVANTRWAPELDNEDWSCGVNDAYLRECIMDARHHGLNGIRLGAHRPCLHFHSATMASRRWRPSQLLLSSEDD